MLTQLASARVEVLADRFQRAAIHGDSALTASMCGECCVLHRLLPRLSTAWSQLPNSSCLEAHREGKVGGITWPLREVWVPGL